MYTRQRLVDFSDISIKQINDNFSAIFLKLSGNIDTMDLRSGAITTDKVKDGAITADKISVGAIEIGHLDDGFLEGLDLLENPIFTSYAEQLAIVDGHVQQNATLIEQNAEQINLQAININGLNSDLASLTLRADGIETNVSSIDANLAGLSTTVSQNYSNINQRADRIESNVVSVSMDVSNLSGTVSTHSSKITQLSNSISSKVSYTDYNGVEIASLINQDAYRVTISADAIDLTGITRIYSRFDTSQYAEIYGAAMYFNAGGRRFSIEYDTYMSFMLGNGVRTEFPDSVVFSGSVDFSSANVYGLDTDVDMRHIIECYYSANKCYIDYGGGSRLTVRDRRGDVVGYVNLT